MDPDEQELIGSVLVESDDERSMSPSQSKTDYTRATYSPQLKVNFYETEIKQKFQTPIIGYKSQSWSIQPFSLDEEEPVDGDLLLKCKDQQNSRKLQTMFQQGTRLVRQDIFEKLRKGFLELSFDVFGNYVIQNILQYGDHNQRSYIFEQLKSEIVALSFDQYGCRVVQKLLEINYGQQEFKVLVDILKPEIRNLVIDQSGNHVIQKLVDLAKADIIIAIINGIQGQIYKMSVDSHGCRLIQQTLEISEPEKLTDIYEELVKCITDLCVSQYGNYIVQLLLSKSTPPVVQRVQKLIITNFEKFSCDKFGSNVVDKAVQISNYQFKRDIITMLTQNLPILYRLSNHAYGNYVIQNFCKQCEAKQIQQIYSIIDPVMFKTSFGQHVYQTLLKLK